MTEPPFARILIANRGEIAVRVMQTCREMGIETVAVYSQADAAALHVQLADEAYCIGPAPALESYLNIDAVLAAARASGARAVHPGYGFLAENPRFARAVQDAGLTWIGPAPEVIALLGDKMVAKDLAERAGLPTVPGYQGDDQSPERLAAEAERLDYPIMVKAAAGGGGKGMRVVEQPEGLMAAVEAARRESFSAFGDGRVFLEKLLTHPRHIEIQVMADTRGNAVYLGERDCSVQRRHQKVVEEAPSPVLTGALRNAMGEAALRLVRASGYVNAGTVEFLFSGDSFYFLEVNTRLQVEHPVTEMVTGLDLVRLQIEIAAGHALPFSQLAVELCGHAIEARLYAEDAEHSFLPATGKLAAYRPPQGPGVRNDVGVFAGYEVTPYYDPLLAKLVVHAETRAAAVDRLQRALERYTALGCTTNLGFLHWLATNPDFRAGRVDTDFVTRHWPPGAPEPLPAEALLAAAAFQVTETPARTSEPMPNPWRQTNGWRAGGAPRSFSYLWQDRGYAVHVRRLTEEQWELTADGETQIVRIERPGADLVVLVGQEQVRRFSVVESPNGLDVAWRGRVYMLLTPRLGEAQARARGAEGEASLASDLPGTVVKIAVEQGDEVALHQPLVVLEAMKMEHVIEAPYAGVVRDVLVEEGEIVPAGRPVVRLEAS